MAFSSPKCRRPLRAVDLFCGAGGLSLGLRRAGLDVVKAYDNLPDAGIVYRRNIDDAFELADLSDLLPIAKTLRELEIDMLCGGSPCQDFSSSGLRKEAERAALTHVLTFLTQHLLPEWVLFENVPTARRSKTWSEMRSKLREAGYGITELVLDCSRYGVPQKRKRLFLIGRRGEAADFLKSAIEGAAAEKPMSMRDEFGDELRAEYIYRHARARHRRSVYSIDEPHPTIRSTNRPAPKIGDGQYVFISGREDRRTVYSADEPSPTVCRKSGEGMGPRHVMKSHPLNPVPPTQAVALTRDQIARVQGFPKWWDWSGIKLRNRDIMVANAVPAPVAEILGKLIIERHFGLSLPPIPDGFRIWLRRGGLSGRSVRNVVYRVRRAHRMLGGRTYRTCNEHIQAIAEIPEFNGMAVRARSDYRAALYRLHEWQSLSPTERRSGYRSRRTIADRTRRRGRHG